MKDPMNAFVFLKEHERERVPFLRREHERVRFFSERSEHVYHVKEHINKKRELQTFIRGTKLRELNRAIMALNTVSRGTWHT